jgi:hypothetical protein
VLRGHVKDVDNVVQEKLTEKGVRKEEIRVGGYAKVKIETTTPVKTESKVKTEFKTEVNPKGGVDPIEIDTESDEDDEL